MNHVTLATGHSRVSPRAEVGDDAIDAIAPLLHEGGALPGPTGYSLRWTSPPGLDVCLYTVHRDRDGAPLVTAGVAHSERDAEALWQILADLQERTTGRPPAAPRPVAPWCAAVILPGILDDPAVHWLGDLERCVAWAWIEERRRHG